jgi:hypothetical protein
MLYYRLRPIITTALFAVTALACSESASDRVLSLDATGALLGVTFVDRNGNGTFDLVGDVSASNVSVQVLTRGGGSEVATTTSNAQGVFQVGNLPVGEYEVRIDSRSIADSLRLIKVDSAHVRIAKDDTVGVLVTIGYPTVTVREARALTPGKRVFIEAVTHNAFGTYGDSTLHVADTSGAIRATRVQPVAVTSGQRVRLLGTTAVNAGIATLTDVTAFVLGAGSPAPPVTVSTAVAARADGGKLDAALAQVENAVIVGSQTTPSGDVVLSVNDGSGLLEVVIARSTGIPTTAYVPGATLKATGVLVPTAAAGVWALKPRTTSDLTVSFTTVTIAQARTMPAGRVVTIEAVALNNWISFADSTVHLNDSTGSLRATRVAPVNLFAGDRVRFLGTLALRDGQTIITFVTPTVLGVGVLPLPQVLTTKLASTADGGLRDAALVRVNGATIDSVATQTNSDVLLFVDDGSGKLEVLLDRDVGFAISPFVKGAILDITGLLITKPGGAQWLLKPRQPSDVVVR